MRHAAVVVLVGLGVVACSSTKPVPPPTIVPVGSRLIFSTGSEGLISVCDRGNRVYLTTQGSVAVAVGGCPDGSP